MKLIRGKYLFADVTNEKDGILTDGAVLVDGEKIAEVGETGIATGPHLHFEIHKGETYLNPIYYVAHS